MGQLILAWMKDAVRDELGVSSITLPDDYIENGIPYLTAVRRASRSVPGWASLANDERDDFNLAVVYALCQASIQRLQTLYATGERAFDAGGGNYDWKARKAELDNLADAYFNRAAAAKSGADSFVPITFATRGPSKSLGYRSPSVYRPAIVGGPWHIP